MNDVSARRVPKAMGFRSWGTLRFAPGTRRLAFGTRAIGFLSAVCWLLSLTAASAQTAQQLAGAREFMVEQDLIAAGIKSRPVLAAMRATPRHEFVPADQRQFAYFDMSLPIGERQTISAPFVVAYMTEQLDVHPTDKVLEIGTG